ncbi:VOC family protein [Nocardia transvalensis]|uniref:VOC family protein n=1 Tax=Nocardia transvalensis TaxID=37333 RepID=UPI001893E29C|nr:VOC family protein [Nocardia transvalensis]MBF6327266.1 VOC family protein [Nocardia transvalensis]
MKSVNPYLLFNGNAEEAFTFYQSVFGVDAQFVRFSEMGGGAGLPEGAADLIAHVAIPLGGEHMLMASDCPPGQTVNTANPAYAVSVDVESREEAERLFAALSAGGDVTMPLDKTEWAEAFGMVTDKYSVPWMIGYTPAER